MRAVVYARYSSDLQREASIEDQIRLCRKRIEHEGWEYIHAYTDRALSGATALRPAYQSLLEDARHGGCRRPLQATTLCRGALVHPLRGRDQRVACRPQGHDERALPEGPSR